MGRTSSWPTARQTAKPSDDVQDEEMRLAIGSAGRRYVETHHDWAEITGRLEEVYHEVIRFGV
jgi:glycosyltransferase involved in cell wall biosynthesis